MTPQERAHKLLADHEGDFMEQHTNEGFAKMESLIAGAIRDALLVDGAKDSGRGRRLGPRGLYGDLSGTMSQSVITLCARR